MPALSEKTWCGFNPASSCRAVKAQIGVDQRGSKVTDSLRTPKATWCRQPGNLARLPRRRTTRGAPAGGRTGRISLRAAGAGPSLLKVRTAVRGAGFAAGRTDVRGISVNNEIDWMRSAEHHLLKLIRAPGGGSGARTSARSGRQGPADLAADRRAPARSMSGYR